MLAGLTMEMTPRVRVAVLRRARMGAVFAAVFTTILLGVEFENASSETVTFFGIAFVLTWISAYVQHRAYKEAQSALESVSAVPASGD
jgi:hypothetical protein